LKEDKEEGHQEKEEEVIDLGEVSIESRKACW